MGVRKQLVRDCVQEQCINLEYLPTEDMPADIFTKALGKTLHLKCVNGLRMSSD